MAAVTVTLTGICGGGEHLTYVITGAKTMTVDGSLDDTQAPVTDDEARAFVKVLAKLAKAGRTLNQARNIMQNGVTVTV
jgi:hypothetical protein